MSDYFNSQLLLDGEEIETDFLSPEQEEISHLGKIGSAFILIILFPVSIIGLFFSLLILPFRLLWAFKKNEECKLKIGSKDIKLQIRISGEELSELQRHTWQMAEAFGLDRRIENYQGKRPIGLYSWDFDCLLAVIEDALDDPKEYPVV